jgi:hypothetical protein
MPMGSQPLLQASGNILPFRFVELSGAFTGTQANAASDRVLGATDGSINIFNGTYNAPSGSPINLQPSETIQITAGGTVSATNLLTSDSSGRAVAGTTGQMCCYMALEDAVVGEVFWAFRFGPILA